MRFCLLLRLAVALLCAAVPVFAGTFSVETLTGDADAGIAASSALTHAINVADTGNVKLNGAVFTGSGSGTNPATNNYATSGYNNSYGGFSAPVSGVVGGMMANFLYGGSPATLTLKNLRVGQTYETAFYDAAFGGVGGRLHNVTTSDGASYSYDENIKEGSRLLYNFTAQSSSLTFTFTPQSSDTFHHYAFSNRIVGGEALLTDNFYVSSNPSPSNLNFNLAARQGGLIVQSAGPVNWVGVNDAQVGNTGSSVDGGNYLRTASSTGIAALDRNFNSTVSAGGLLIAFDLAPDVSAGGAGNWSGLCFGQAAAGKNGSITGTQAHFGVRFRGSTGTLQAYDGATVLTPTEPKWSSAGVTSQLHHIEILLTDSVDGNPFDGSGETHVEIFADGVSRYTYTKAGGYADNYLNFQSSSVGGIDNLLIGRLSLTPEAPVFVSQPQSQTLWRGDGLTLTSAATGYPSFSLQWYLNGVAIAGATGNTYTIPDAAGAGGSYTVVATNSQGSATSQPAIVNVIAPTKAQRTWEGLGPSSRCTGLAISEINYHPADRPDGRNLEFIEIYNSNPWMEELAGFRLTGDVDFTFPGGTQIAGKGFLVVAKVPGDLQATYGLTNVLGPYAQSLANSGGTLRLKKPSGAVVLEVTWSDRDPWPLAADGAGHSLVLARPSYGEASPRAWDASATIGGSPGAMDLPPGDPLDNVVLNEVLAHAVSPQTEFVELRNDSPDAVDLSGCTLSDSASSLTKFTIANGTMLAGRGTLAFTQDQLGFALSSSGESLYLSNPTGTRVIDCVRFAGSAAGVSLGRANDQEGAFRPLTTVTPGAPNSGFRVPEVLISEIFFDPPSGDDLDEWLELYNPGNTLDVSGWRLTEGIDFVIPNGTTMASGSRLVIAKDAVRTRANHPEINPALVVGGYGGTLGNGGERLTLVRPEAIGASTNLVEVDTVIYTNAGRWSQWADGGGSSLEVRDLHADRMIASSWADSDETAKSTWATVSVAGALDLGHGSINGADRVESFLMGTGESLLDDVKVLNSTNTNVVTNSTFSSGSTGWTLQGNQSRSSISASLGFGGGSALQIRSSGRGDPDGNRLFSALTSTLAPGSIATVSAHARWLRGTPELILRLKGGYLETLAKLPVPENLGTPGAINSQAVANAGPAISEVTHRPLLPVAGLPIRVFARVVDPDGIASTTLRWRLETSSSFANVAMHDDGLTGDIVAGDGIFTAYIPAQAPGALVVFQVESTDSATAAASSVFPPNAPAHACLVRVGDAVQGGDFAAYRLWMTAANISTWANRPRFGNEPLDATFVYNGVRAIYGCGAWYKGSEASTPGYDSPLGGLCGYHVDPPQDDLVLGENNFTLDFIVRDATDQREQLMFWMAEQLKLPNLYRRYIHLFINGTRRGVLYDDVQEPGGDVVDEFFPNDKDGSLYKTDNWNEGDDSGSSTSGGEPNILKHYDSAGQHKLARYRWNWRPRASGTSNNFGDLFTLIDAVNATSNYQTAVESVVDVNNWMRTFAFHDLCSFWDAFGNDNHKNTYLYKPASGRWTQFSWDMDVGLGVFNDPVDAPLFPATVDPKVDALQAFPAFRRIYWGAMTEAFNTFYSAAGVTPLLQRKYNALAANGIALSSPFVPTGAYGLSITQFIEQRRSFIQTQLSSVAAGFAITSASSVTVTIPSVTITGTAPVNVQTITVNNVSLPVIWNSVTAWSINVVPAPGTNSYVVRALDAAGAQIGTGTVSITFTGTNAWPALRINEWMAANGGSTLDPADGASDDWIELYNPTSASVNLAGWRLSDSSPAPTEFSFPSAYSIGASGRLLAWCDEQTAQSAPPNSLHLPFKLSAGGETLTLKAPDGTVVDSVTFGSQITDVSQGRVPDGGTTIDFLANPSAGTANSSAVPAPSATVISSPGGNLNVTITTMAGFTYQLQTKQDLLDAAWVNVGTAVMAKGSTLSFPVGQPDAQRFYRAVRTP